MGRLISLFLILAIFLSLTCRISSADEKDIFDRLSLYLPLNKILEIYPIEERDGSKYWIVASVDENNHLDLDLFTTVGDGIIFKSLDHKVLDYQNPNFKLFSLGKDNPDALLVWDREGSGAFLSYEVFMVKDDELYIPEKGSSFYQGDIKTFDGGYELTSSDKRWFFVWDGEKFEKNIEGDFLSYPDNFVSNDNSLDENTQLVTYRVEKDEISWLSSDNVDLKVGQKLLLRRLNPLEDATCRIVFSSGNISYEGNGLFLAKKQGKAIITLVPGGYDWSKAKTLSVTISAS
ncbi:hypothetical protein Thena_0372 [Thermodesulfobium narugense DSM 14796]|uniref:Uncharacterized protein n=1 Tax=Thermodesulfobium narugense DSM 14796 TaxID=747365 RepID=M1E666_9BACT|nr:hypothetical protein [Thermodesulfobium narugense]AEE14018.1 hypothetical protein Thena_0372 [Thermodesulfobium narugense DSM 14796]